MGGVQFPEVNVVNMLLQQQPLYLLVLVLVASAVQVSTKNGRLKGEYVRSGPGKGCHVFRFIPYAKPTIASSSSNVFEDPLPIGNWKGVRDATIPLPGNSSTNQTRGTENCLYLSVYTNRIRRWLPPSMVKTYQASPVQVYFKGCAIDSSGNQTKSETDTMLIKDVVKVLVNHRERSNSSGDIATKDQLLALEWIKTNILTFGGDPQSVAVFQGHSGLADIDINRLSVPGY